MIWFHSFLIIENHVVENPDEIVVNIGRQGFTEATSRLHEFLTSTELSRYVCIVFAVKETTIFQRTVVVEIAKFIYFEFLETLASTVRHDRDDRSGFQRSRGGGWQVKNSTCGWLGGQESPLPG